MRPGTSGGMVHIWCSRAIRSAPQAVKSKKPLFVEKRGFSLLAGWTGLEPAASGVTGRRYNQLNYHPKIGTCCLSFERSSWVGATGLEPVTPGL